MDRKNWMNAWQNAVTNWILKESARPLEARKPDKGEENDLKSLEYSYSKRNPAKRKKALRETQPAEE